MKKMIVLLAVAIAGLALTTTSANADLVGHWKFDGDFTDSANSNDGAALGTTAPTAGVADGAFVGSGAVTFDGSDTGKVDIAGVHTLIGNQMSISFWEFSSGTENEGYFMGSGTNSTGTHSIFLRRAANAPNEFRGEVNKAAGTSSGGLYLEFDDTAVARNQWNHNLIVLDASSTGVTGSWYVNGGAITNAGTGGSVDLADLLQTNLFVGNRVAGERGFLGLIDDLQVYDVTLDAADAATLFADPGSVIPELGATFNSDASGLWSAGSTWVGSTAPTATDTVTVLAAHTVTVGAGGDSKALNVDGTLEIGLGAAITPIAVTNAMTLDAGTSALALTWEAASTFGGASTIANYGSQSGTFATTSFTADGGALDASAYLDDVDYVTGDAVTVTLFDLLDGDTDLDGDVDNADAGALIGSFTGSTGTGKDWFDGDTDFDGDVDNADVGALIGAFGSSPAGSLTDTATIANLCYDPVTGNLTMDASEAQLSGTITSFQLESDAGFADANYLSVAGGTFGGGFEDVSDSVLGDSDFTFIGFSGLHDMGNVAPTGLTLVGLEAFLTNAVYTGSSGSGQATFDLVLAHAVPEPTSLVLLGLGSLMMLRRRSR